MGKYRNLANECSRLEVQVTRDKQSVVASEKERESAKSKADAAVKALASEVANHGIAKEEANKARIALQTVKTAATQENKRRESELASALARLNKAASSASSLSSTPVITLNPLHDIGQNRADKQNVSAEVTLLEASLRKLEERHSLLQDEALQLREVIGDIEVEVQSTLSAIGHAVPSLAQQFDNGISTYPMPHLVLPPNELTEHLSRLFIRLREAVVTSVTSQQAEAAMLDQQRYDVEAGKVRELEESLAAMQAELDDARLDAQESQNQLDAARSEEEGRIRQATLDAKEEEKVKLVFKKQRRELEEERRKFTEAAVRLGQERLALDQDRIAFMEERAAAKAKRKEREGETRLHPVPSADLAKDGPVKNAHKVARAPPPRAATKTSATVSSTTTALQNILAAGSDTPPIVVARKTSKAKMTAESRIVLSPSRGNVVPQAKIRAVQTKTG